MRDSCVALCDKKKSLSPGGNDVCSWRSYNHWSYFISRVSSACKLKLEEDWWRWLCLWLGPIEECLHSESNSFLELKYCVYSLCHFIMFFHGTKVASMHMVHVTELCVAFSIDKIRECELVLVWLKQYCWALVLDEWIDGNLKGMKFL